MVGRWGTWYDGYARSTQTVYVYQALALFSFFISYKGTSKRPALLHTVSSRDIRLSAIAAAQRRIDTKNARTPVSVSVSPNISPLARSPQRREAGGEGAAGALPCSREPRAERLPCAHLSASHAASSSGVTEYFLASA